MKKGRKTTIVAVISGILGVSVFIMWYLGKIETTELTIALAAIAYLGNMVTSYFAKDATASHTTDLLASGGGELPPDDEDPPPPPPPGG